VSDGGPPQVAVLIVAEQIVADARWGVHAAVESTDLPLESSVNELSSMDITDDALMALGLTRKHFQMVQADTKRVLEPLSAQFKIR